MKQLLIDCKKLKRKVAANLIDHYPWIWGRGHHYLKKAQWRDCGSGGSTYQRHRLLGENQ